MRDRGGNKYGAKKADCASGHTHASQAEAKRCSQLTLLQRAGQISDLEQQPKFPCIVNGKKLCTYVADFAYQENGQRKVEDVKGVKTPVYRLKKKIVEALYLGTEIVEVRA